MKRKIDFIGVGVQKSATTWVYKCLTEHPDVSPAKRKEVHYFDFYYKKGEEWYHSFFDLNDKICGEISPYYIFKPQCPELIFEYNPDIKLFVTLRHPTDRAVEQYQMEFNRGDTRLSFREAFYQDFRGIRKRGLYQEQLDRYKKFKHFKIFMYYELKENPEAFINTLYKHLGLSKFTPPSLFQTVMPVSYINRANVYPDEITEADKYYSEYYKVQKNKLFKCKEFIFKENRWIDEEEKD